MEAITAVFLTGFLVGIITAVVGGSSIICFPAMLAVACHPSSRAPRTPLLWSSPL